MPEKIKMKNQGRKMKDKKVEERKHELNRGEKIGSGHHYISVTGIVVKDGKYLIVKRGEDEKNFPGKWTVPGGKLEREDYSSRKPDTKAGHWYQVFEDLVRREIREEAGIEIKDIDYLTNLSFMRDDGIPTVIVSLYANYDSGEVKLNEELTDYKWVSLEEAREYDLIDGIYEELEMLDRLKKGKEAEIDLGREVVEEEIENAIEGDETEKGR